MLAILAGSQALADPGDGSSLLGIIRVSTFSATTPDAVRDALRSLSKAGVKAFVVDLRNNGGGSFPAGLKLTSMFLPKGVVVYVADFNGVRDILEAEARRRRRPPPLVATSIARSRRGRAARRRGARAGQPDRAGRAAEPAGERGHRVRGGGDDGAAARGLRQ